MNRSLWIFVGGAALVLALFDPVLAPFFPTDPAIALATSWNSRSSGVKQVLMNLTGELDMKGDELTMRSAG